MILKNPFSDYGGIVTESRFVGRKDEIQAIKNRLLGVSYGNLAIIGLPRIGKSSLAWNAVYKNKENLISNKIISVWVSFGEYESIYDAFADIIFDIGETLVELKELSLSLNEINDKIIKSESNLEKKKIHKTLL
jgi:AAA+ ATPase superfamily predicted ATPase